MSAPLIELPWQKSSPKHPVPPGPKGLGHLKATYEFMGGEQVPFMRKMQREYGDFVNFRLGTFNNYLISDPEMIHEVLIGKSKVFKKDAITHDLEELLGQGLLTAEGEYWRRNRKIAAPALKRKQIASYADTMVSLTAKHMDAWKQGHQTELHHDMMQLTMAIVVKTLFNLDPGEEVAAVEESIEKAMHFFHLNTHTLWRFMPEALPMKARDDFYAAIEMLNSVIYKLIEDRRNSDEEGDDLLHRLILATDEDGNHMTDAQLRDEAITMFLAGHETTALTISYTWRLLAENPDVARRLYQEVDDILGGKPATVDDVRKLKYTEAIIKESLRIHPPAWIIGREPTEDVEIGPYLIPKGAQVLMCQSVLQMLPKYFVEPTQFRPERWLDPEFEKSLPRHVYMPFGGGPRVCIGNHFAMMEAILVVATMTQHVELDMDLSIPLTKQPAVTWRPTSPLNISVSRR